MFKSFPRICSYDNAAVSKLVHMKVQKYRKAVKKKNLSPQVPMVGNSPKSSWWDFSPNKDAWEFWNLPPIQTQLPKTEKFPSVLNTEQASVQAHIHSANICVFPQRSHPRLSVSAVSSVT